jgi:atypical dual specificity phosphatase
MHRFYWLEENRLAGCSRPGTRPGRHAADADDLAADLALLRARGIGAILTLTETPLPESGLAEAALDMLHLPVADFGPPTTAQFLDALRFIDRHRAEGTPVAVHCLAGQGRTGSILAATLIRDGATAGEAISAVRAVCPGAVETPPQVEALHRFAIGKPWLD